MKYIIIAALALLLLFLVVSGITGKRVDSFTVLNVENGYGKMEELNGTPIDSSNWLLDDVYSTVGGGELPTFRYKALNEVLVPGIPNQGTNNVRNQVNPDNGTCTPKDICGVYLDNK
jgi:hypothetical protein